MFGVDARDDMCSMLRAGDNSALMPSLVVMFVLWLTIGVPPFKARPLSLVSGLVPRSERGASLRGMRAGRCRPVFLDRLGCARSILCF